MSDLTPEMLAMLDGEQKMIKDQKRGFRNVKIEENDSWLIRYLPYEFGPNKLFYLRVAQHWIMKKPHFCPRHSAPEIGGDPNAPCQICDEADSMADNQDQAIRKAGFKASATQQWLMYCFVLQRDLAKNRGEIEVVEDPEELWTPYEYWHNKWGFEEFIDIFRKCARRERNPVNVLDFINGCNFWARSTTKGINLQREDPGPIADATDEEIQGIIDFAWKKIRPPTYTRLTDEQIDAALIKLDESVRSFREAGGGSSTRSSKSKFREQDDDQALAPQTRSAAPQVRSAAPSVARPATPPAVASRPTPPPARSAAPAPRASAPAPAPEAPNPDDGDLAPQAPRARAASAPQVRSAAPAAPVAPRAAPLADRLRSRPPANPVAAGAPVQSTIDPEEDNVTDENRDPAPPAEAPIEPAADDAPPAVSAEGSPAEPPRVAAPSAPAPRVGQASAPRVGAAAPQLSNKLRAGIANAATRK